MTNIETKYLDKCNTVSDINEHLPTLRKYAEECEHVTEMGVRWITSTWALLAGRPKKMISYDILNPSHWGADIGEVISYATKEQLDFTFYQADVLTIEIEPTDLLFIDTVHNYIQLKNEFRLHADKVRKYIILHDTTLFGHTDETGGGIGLIPALKEFLSDNTDWVIHETFTNNNGLTILKRISSKE